MPQPTDKTKMQNSSLDYWIRALHRRLSGFLILNLKPAGDVRDADYDTLSEVHDEESVQDESEVAVFDREGNCIGVFKLFGPGNRRGESRFGFKLLPEYKVQRMKIASVEEKGKVEMLHVKMGEAKVWQNKNTDRRKAR